VLFRGKQQRLAKRLVPGAKNLSRNPRVGRLADGENARRLDPKEHWRSLNPFSAAQKRHVGRDVTIGDSRELIEPHAALAQLDVMTYSARSRRTT
jgi:hypothetical protein